MEALKSQTVPPARIIVSHSGDDTPNHLFKSLGDGAILLHSDERLYAGAARNVGLRRVDTEWVAFLDADVVPAPDWLERMTVAARTHPQKHFFVGSVGSAVSGGYWGLGLWFFEFSSIHPYMPAGTRERGPSGNMIVRCADMRDVGGFPDGLMASEDVRLCGLLSLTRSPGHLA